MEFQIPLAQRRANWSAVYDAADAPTTPPLVKHALDRMIQVASYVREDDLEITASFLPRMHLGGKYVRDVIDAAKMSVRWARFDNPIEVRDALAGYDA